MRGGIVLIPRWDVSHCSPLFSPAINQDSNTSCYYDHLLQWERWLPNSLVHWVKKSQLFFFFLSEQFIMLWSLVRHFAHRIPLLTQVLNGYQTTFRQTLQNSMEARILASVSGGPFGLDTKCFFFLTICAPGQRDSGRVKHFAQPINLSLAKIHAFYLEVH